ncbi:class I SAM-dependent methyltransferase [Desulfomicrobium baculatum]|uniref:Methyltransferase type 11 n=1 Tax=Desulfomicrobium baculatum (strain DSM 4028 / VKM B-1378 / X) TaxID=525897 RepID=C7LP32_DESBD|nr:methyltransferase domain-containing protein [Desulfomicrobium baculatum]ACU91348.1 hypothetical protein Dbac_3274 [Desulfomicrobium baculatum DSM 4028]
MAFTYSDVVFGREECFKRFGTVFDLPLLQNGMEQAFLSLNTRAAVILDFGCGSAKPFKCIVEGAPYDNVYYSMDTDRSAGADFASFINVPGDLAFDFIIANQVIEHMALDDAHSVLTQARSRLKTKGVFIATVPNVQHPVRYWGDVDHKLPISYANLYALFAVSGYEVAGLWRYSKAVPNSLLDRFLARRMQKIYRIDWADSICLVAKKLHSEDGAG